MATHSQTQHSSPPASMFSQPLSSYSRSNPIDLTLDDDSQERPRQMKRPRIELDSSNAPSSNGSTPPAPSPPLSTPPGPSSAHQSSNSSLHGSPLLSHPPRLTQPQGAYRPHFSGPSDSSAFFPNRPVHTSSARSPSVTGAFVTNGSQQLQQQQSQHNHHHHQRANQIIDLTSSPSPPPQNGFPPQHSQEAQRPAPPVGMLSVPPKTPVCIGQLTVTALVLYPISYLQSPGAYSENMPESDWASVRLQHDPTAKQRNPKAEETIHIKTPPAKTVSGEILPGENFGVVEQKVATVLGPMLGKGLIRIDAKVRRGVPNVRRISYVCMLYNLISLSAASYSTVADAYSYTEW